MGSTFDPQSALCFLVALPKNGSSYKNQQSINLFDVVCDNRYGKAGHIGIDDCRLTIEY